VGDPARIACLIRLVYEAVVDASVLSTSLVGARAGGSRTSASVGSLSPSLRAWAVHVQIDHMLSCKLRGLGQGDETNLSALGFGRIVVEM
jgi:hypothetical protein